MMAEQIIAEFRALGAWCILHGPEIWIAVTIWALGAACGVAVSWAALEIAERREKTRERIKSAVDHPGECGSGFSPGGADPGKRRGG